jgi:hypothetical protein
MKAWAAVGQEIGLPESLEHKSKICRRRFKAARLDDFTQVACYPADHNERSRQGK